MIGILATAVGLSSTTFGPIADWISPHTVSRALQGKTVAAYGGKPTPELVAELVHAEFVQEGSALRLERPRATQNRLLERHRKLRALALEAQLGERRKSRGPIDEAREIATQLLDRRAAEPTSPAGRLAETILRSIPVEALAAIPVGESVTYSNRSSIGLSRFPPLASTEIDRYRETLGALQIMLQGAEIPRERAELVRLFVRPTEDTGATETLLLRVFAGPKFLSATLGIYDAQGAIRDFGVFRFEFKPLAERVSLSLPETAIETGDLARDWAEARPTHELMGALRGPDPVAALLDHVLGNVSAAIGRPILVDVEDMGAAVAQLFSQRTIPLPDFVRMCAREGLEWQERGNWILIRASDPIGTALERVDRAALRAYVRTLWDKKRRDNAILSRFACDTGPLAYDGDFARSVDRLMTRLGVPERFNPPASYALALYGAIDPTSHEHLRRGGSLAVSSLPKRAQGWAWRCIRPFETSGPAAELDRHPSLALPRGAGDAMLFAPGLDAWVVTSFNTDGSKNPAFGNGLSLEEWRQLRSSIPAEALPALLEGKTFQLGRRGGVTFRFVAPNLTIYKFDLPDLPIDQGNRTGHLPDEFEFSGTGESQSVATWSLLPQRP